MEDKHKLLAFALGHKTVRGHAEKVIEVWDPRPDDMTRCWEAVFASSSNLAEYPTDSEMDEEVPFQSLLLAIQSVSMMHMQGTAAQPNHFCFQSSDLVANLSLN